MEELYNTDVLNVYRGEKKVLGWQENYERRYKKDWEKRPMPRVTAVSLDVDLRPETQQYTVRGKYQLQNKTKKPIPAIVVMTDPDLKTELTFSVPATLDIFYQEMGFRTYNFKTPLQPGETINLSFVLIYENRGFLNDDINTDMVANGTFLTMPGPRIGYISEAEISSENERRDRGLPPRGVMAPVTDTFALQNVYIGNDADWIRFEAIVRTAPDQIAVAPGYLKREWQEKGRRCFAYKMDKPIRNFYSILSARYAVAKDKWIAPDGRSVALEIYYHPPHTFNIERMMEGMKASLSYCSENLSPYQFRQLRIVEFPIYQEFAQSFPNTIPYSEGLGFIARINDDEWDIDYPLYITAHETAHQWWAHQVLGANVEGATLLSESLAEYCALKTIEEQYGYFYVRRFLDYNLNAYLEGRSSEQIEEHPLVRVANQPYIHYNKGALAFYALASRIGEKKLNRALARFVRENAFQDPPYPTAPQLLRILREVVSQEDQEFLTDWFEKITLYDLEVTQAEAKPRSKGNWRIRATIYAKKYHADGSGKEKAVPLNDTFDIVVYPPAPQGREAERRPPLFVKQVRLTKDSTELTFDVSEEPAAIEIDPYRKVIERFTKDNTFNFDLSDSDFPSESP